MPVELVPASLAHVGRIARRMRAIDQLECTAKGRDPAFALRYSLASSSFALTALVDRSPHAMFGVTPFSLAEGVGRPWFLGTEAVFDHPREMLQTGRKVVGLMLASFPRLENVIACANDQGLRMLRRWDFEIGEEVQMFGGVGFLPFWKVR